MLLASAMLGACSAIAPMPGSRSRTGMLELDVRPRDAQIFVDDDYQGLVSGWAAQTVPLKAGPRRLELRAQGHRAQRFDVTIEAGQVHVLRVRLLRIDDDDNDEGADRGRENSFALHALAR